MKITIVKYENYPQEQPNSYAVGFDVKLENGRGFYIDTLVGYDELEGEASDEEVGRLAYEKLRMEIEAKVDQMVYATPSIIGLTLDVSTEYEEAGNVLRGSVEGLTTKVDQNREIIETIIGANKQPEGEPEGGVEVR